MNKNEFLPYCVRIRTVKLALMNKKVSFLTNEAFAPALYFIYPKVFKIRKES